MTWIDDSGLCGCAGTSAEGADAPFSEADLSWIPTLLPLVSEAGWLFFSLPFLFFASEPARDPMYISRLSVNIVAYAP